VAHLGRTQQKAHEAAVAAAKAAEAALLGPTSVPDQAPDDGETTPKE
jgi:hypothetical protein